MDFWAFLGFSLVVTLLAVVIIIAYFKSKGTTSFFIAGRKAPWYLIVGSLMASTISGAAFLGMQASFYTTGASVFWILIGCSLAFFIMCFFIGPKLRRFGQFTIPQYLAERFDSPLLKPIFSLLITIWMVILMGTLYVQGGLLFENIFGMSYTTGILLIGAITIFATVFGGMITVLNSDFIAMFILLIVSVITAPLVISAAGGWGEITTVVISESPDYFTNTSGVGAFASLSLVIIWTLGYLGHPGFLTRFFTAKNEREVIKAGIGISLLYLPFWIMIFATATAARILYPNINDPETIWIISLFDYVPSFVVGLGMAAILVGIISSVNTWLLTSATSLTLDIYHTLINKNASEKQVLNYSKILIVTLAVIAVPIGIWRPASIIEMMNIAYAIAGSAGGLVILLSMYYQKMTKQAAWAGIISGASIAITWRTGQIVGFAPSNIDPIIPTLVISLIIIILVSKMTQPTDKTSKMFLKLQKTALEQK